MGFVAPGFEQVGEAFGDALAGSHGHGSALHIRRGGTCVVDLWGGLARRDGSLWQADTTSVVFSCTKALLAVLVGELVREGRLDLDAPVREVWPEFAQNGKSEVPVRWLLSHKAGLPAVREDLQMSAVLDWDVMVDVLARQEPLMTPGEGHVYHALTYGWLVGEVIRRVAGVSVGEFFASRIAEPLKVRAWIGAPKHELPGIADLFNVPGAMLPSLQDPEVERWMTRAMTMGHAFPAELATPDDGFNRDDVRMAQVPGAGGVASARAMATIWSATVSDGEGVRLLDADVIAEMTKEQSAGTPLWPFPGPHPRWGTGFMLNSERRPFLSESSFGHDGAGGQVTFADPVHEIGFAYLTNDLQSADDERGIKLVRALQQSLRIGV
ncbi:serine hydrolase domain-containing protein [Arthrobacter sp. BE255]|uniref:serine hydrolase domain-containing protein n=1 Tax=Arthrobacter sp. BE255 TaxID=2817721 RepID=UPI00286C3F58|nr:serine hydrolase domain-containing protein [Arthrobacter sp. BE255]